MGRPAKNVTLISKNLTNDELINRIELEEKVKGSNDKIFPPDYLSDNQKGIFKYIVEQLSESGILGNLDIYILATCSIAIDRLEVIENKINKNLNLICNNQFMASKDKYTKDLYRCCNELSLSPQSRAKLANINLNKKGDDPLLNALKDEDD